MADGATSNRAQASNGPWRRSDPISAVKCLQEKRYTSARKPGSCLLSIGRRSAWPPLAEGSCQGSIGTKACLALVRMRIDPAYCRPNDRLQTDLATVSDWVVMIVSR
ncbi:unnamed protein product [Protopolystoma xenopodis]|uniref:Uncharacterized protein n=1 Tax=Protopolystoma xenopodis TaxID=117903 RepID=A0A448WZ20_9PLAT|nr:unnamed protein product [Protopolystoma xenopodis]